ncbi:MAG: hypothetical protein M3R36_18370 [Bacteroidota bacterium]|nr:hypothetical protein [Bacteroidota bacterium]
MRHLALNVKQSRNKTILKCVITKEDDTFCSLCLDLNIAMDGLTIKEAENNLLEAIKDYIEVCLEENIPILREVPIEDNPLFNDEEVIVKKFLILLNYDLTSYVIDSYIKAA